MNLKDLYPVSDAILKLDLMKVVELNRKASELGFVIGSEILSFISFNTFDELTRAILSDRSFNAEVNIYFFNGNSMYSSIIYDSDSKLLFIKDLSEYELLKKVKADLITSISHELRTPLSVAMGNLQLIKDFSEDENTGSYILKLDKSLKKIEKIISQLTLLTAAEFGNYSLKFDIFDSENVIREVLSDLDSKIKKKNIKINYSILSPTIKADRFVIYTLLRNLISNAVKYSYKDSEITVSLSDKRISVKDKGIGIRDNEKIRIFERFFRGTEASKHAKGSGLGLAIVKYLCELSGYKLNLDSKWMIGSTFTIILS